MPIVETNYKMIPLATLKVGNWCRNHTRAAMYDAELLLTNTLGGEK